MACFVYIIASADKIYCGWTTDLDKRLKAHNKGTGAKATRGREWKLLYAERYQNRGEAMSREWHLKRDRRFRKLLSDPGLDSSR
jgi:putative endonuclease